MRRVGRFLLLVGFGVVLGLLTLLLVGPRREDPISAIALNRSPTVTPGPAAATSSRQIAAPSADVPSSPDGAELGLPDSEPETTAESAAVSSDIAAAVGPHVRLDDIPASARQWAVKRDDIAAYPPQWCFRLSGSTSESGAAARLHVALDSRASHGSRSARVDTAESLPPDVTAVLWQAVNAQPYRGLRVELVAQVRSEAPVALLFLRAQSSILEGMSSDLGDGQGVNESIPAGTDWMRVAAVDDVPFDASVMYYGVALYGNGSLWLDDVHVNVITATAPLVHDDDSVVANQSIPIVPVWSVDYPANLDFELTRSEAEPLANCHTDPE